MYEELVKLARHCAEKDACINCSVGGCEGPTGLINQLANAIEELNKRFAYEIALEECWYRLENRPLPDIPGAAEGGKRNERDHYSSVSEKAGHR